MFVGLAIGPWVRHSSFTFHRETYHFISQAGGIIETQFGRTYSLFTITTGLLTGLLLFVIFIIPESLAPTSKVAEESYSHSPRRPTFRRHSTADLCSYITSFVKALFSPIVMLLPREALTRQGSKDFNVTFVGAGLFLYLVSNVRILCQAMFLLMRFPGRIATKVDLCQAHIRVDVYSGTLLIVDILFHSLVFPSLDSSSHCYGLSVP